MSTPRLPVRHQQQGNCVPDMTFSPEPHALRRVPVCGERTALPADLVRRSLTLAGSHVQTEDVEATLRCALQAHTGGEHHAFVTQLDSTDARAVWAMWTDGPPTTVELRADCEAVGPPEHGSPLCCEFDGHPGAHTYGIHDPWTER
ncbi:hypothetical protein [Streptomyces sp. NPDC021020]|uniref:hypothetical protein n=1 Tax=Streptomyces sp. NPDC021020 TaxID=3365109 RepID=UPI0037914574